MHGLSLPIWYGPHNPKRDFRRLRPATFRCEPRETNSSSCQFGPHNFWRPASYPIDAPLEIMCPGGPSGLAVRYELTVAMNKLISQGRNDIYNPVE